MNCKLDLHTPQQTPSLPKLKRLTEQLRLKKDYAAFAKASKYFPFFYPGYSDDEAMADILADRETVFADIFYATNINRLHHEVDVPRQELLLRQLFAHVTKDQPLLSRIKRAEAEDILQEDECTMLVGLNNLNEYYSPLCDTYKVEQQKIFSAPTMTTVPFIHPIVLPRLRRQNFKCLFSLRNVEKETMDVFFKHLSDVDFLLDHASKFFDFDLQMFLIEFVGLNIEISNIQYNQHRLLERYEEHDLDALADYLNDFICRLDKACIPHHLPTYTAANLPEISL